jgi:hypothetical protein
MRPHCLLLAALAASAVLLAGCAEAQLDPFGRPYSGDINYPPGTRFCEDPAVDVQPEFVRGNHPAIPIDNAFDARNARAVVKYRVDAQGAVQVLSVDSGDKGYRNHAAIAVRDWKFKPATRGGVAVAAECTADLWSVFRGVEDEPPGQVNQ